MNALKIVFIVIAIIIALPLVIALFIPKEYKIEREITINKPKHQVFDYIRVLKNQERYNKWVMNDPNAKMNYTGVDGAVGSTVAWDSENKQVGKGEQEVKSLDEGKRVDWEIRFERPMQGVSQTAMDLEPVADNQTKVKWTFAGENKYPMTIMNLFIDKILGPDLEKSEQNLKAEIEKL